jgi:IS5 family transposase
MQTSFSELEYASKKKQTRRDIYLGELDCITPWAALERSIAPFYLSSGSLGRPPIGLTRMLRMYVAQQCFNLFDEGMEDALYDSQAIRRFVGIDLARDTAPDATTLLKFRHLLERHQLTESLFNAINAHLAEKGLLLREGTIVDATLIAAPPSTKNQTGKRNPEMHQSKKGNQWYFGMKAHIGVDADSGLVHTVIGTAGNVSDISQAQALLHGGGKWRSGMRDIRVSRSAWRIWKCPSLGIPQCGQASGARWINRPMVSRRNGRNRPRLASVPRSSTRFMW